MTDNHRVDGSCPDTKKFGAGVVFHCCRLIHIASCSSQPSPETKQHEEETKHKVNFSSNHISKMGNSGTGWIFVAVTVGVIFVIVVAASMMHTKAKKRKNMRRGDLERGAGRGHPPLKKQSHPVPKLAPGAHRTPVVMPARAVHQSVRLPNPSHVRQPAPVRSKVPQGRTTNVADLIPKAPSPPKTYPMRSMPAAVVTNSGATKVMNLPPGTSRQCWEPVPAMKDYTKKSHQPLPKTPPQMAKAKGLKLKTKAPPAPAAFNGPVSPMNSKDREYNRDSVVSPVTPSASRRGW